ncbi:MAG: hypothetical protein F6J94_05465 [Moorea sp. SIO1F2]|nr:hypothetical protein [Moorena sp. SIO1F2]
MLYDHKYVKNTTFASPTPDSRLPTPDSRLPTPDSRLPTPDSLLPTPYSLDSPLTTGIILNNLP